MSDANTPEPRQTDKWLEPGKDNIQVIYFLYLAGFVVGITSIIGIVLAYINRDKVTGWMATHYTWAIRTFWISLLYGVISALLVVVLIGIPMLIAVAVFMIVRIIKGLQKASAEEPIDNPQSWLF